LNLINKDPTQTKPRPHFALLAIVASLLLLCGPNIPAGEGRIDPARDIAPVLPQAIWPLIFLLVAAIAALAYLLKNKWQKEKQPERPIRDNRWSCKQITQTFISAIPSMTRELNLELATSTQTEILAKSDTKSMLWDWLNLGENHAEIRVPTTYRYHLRFREPWKLELAGNNLIVVAPAIRASLPPAIHTDQMEFQSSRGWCRASPKELLDKLHRELTPTLSATANDPRRIGLVRETCRQAVAEFVQRWLEGEARWRPGAFTAIQVCFVDEEELPPVPTRKLLDY